MSNNLPPKDIRILKKYDDSSDWGNLCWCFYCYSREIYAQKDNDFDDQILYGIFGKDSGILMEMKMEWIPFNGLSVPRLMVFSEAFPLLNCPTHRKVIRQLEKLKKECFTAEDFSRLLLSLGFTDLSDYPLTEPHAHD